MMDRREMLKTSAAAVGAAALPLGWVGAAEAEKPRKLLYFTRNVGFYHSVVVRKGDQLSHSEKTLTDLGTKHGFEVTCTKDGTIFDGDISQYDAIGLYCNGDLTKPNPQNEPPMTPEGVKKLMAAVEGGKGLIAFHSTCNCWRTAGPAVNGVDPFIALLGAGFVSHGPQQKATMRITDPAFPGLKDLGDKFEMLEEWYAMKEFDKDLHVLIVQDTEGMKGPHYQRPPYPSTWARMQGKGRVYFTSMAHRENVWASDPFQQIVLGGLSWVFGNVAADVKPNVEQVTPKAWDLK